MKISLLTALLVLLTLSGCATNSKRVKQAMLETNLPIIITQQGTLYPNTAGGVDFRVDLVNTSDKTIKYVKLLLKAKNRVGDYVIDEVTGVETKMITVTGPIKRGEHLAKYMGLMPQWTNVWYNHSIICGGVIKAKIIYMDNEEIEIDDTKLYSMIDVSRCNNATSAI